MCSECHGLVQAQLRHLADIREIEELKATASRHDKHTFILLFIFTMCAHSAISAPLVVSPASILTAHSRVMQSVLPATAFVNTLPRARLLRPVAHHSSSPAADTLFLPTVVPIRGSYWYAACDHASLLLAALTLKVCAVVAAECGV